MAITVRPARTDDVASIEALIEPFVRQRILLGKDPVVLYEAIQQFVVAEVDGVIAGCGALHVMWRDLGEVRTVAVAESHRGRGVGSAIVGALESNARGLGLSRLFCLTFETEFFGARGYEPIGEVGDQHTEALVSDDVYAELVRSPDEGIAEFLNLARVKPNTLGNTRMLKSL
ncbi:MAG: amino-acid N-acetyltransferase [Microbacteriaceae bacterium]